jgi:beta-1,2-mannobiose phosphorylase / 1,2-beta-oligomannan phosphorylase
MQAPWKKTRVLTPADVPASSAEFRVLGAFNPAAVRVGESVVLIVRVAEQPQEERAGYLPLPRYEPTGRQVIDWLRADAVEKIDRRVVRVRETGAARLTSASYLRIVSISFDHVVQHLGPAILPQGECEEYGIEDPRITRLDDRYFVTYVSVSRHGASTSLVSTADFQSFERHGVIFPPENKDVVLLPERVGGQYVALHRPVGNMPFTQPEMWIARSPDLFHWGDHAPLYSGQAVWETGRVGAGAPPVRTPRGWLEIYHGNRRPTGPGDIGAYCGGAMLLDAADPGHVAQIAAQPLLAPSEPYETDGFVPNVVFPGGFVEVGERIHVYYGAADESTAVAQSTWEQLWTAFDSPEERT